MTTSFDPGLLQGLTLGLDDGSELTPVDESELVALIGPDVRRRCGAVRLATAVLSEALLRSGSGEPTEEDVLGALSQVLARVADLRDAALAAIGLDRAAPDFGYAWNAVTSSVLQLLLAEQLMHQARPDRPLMTPEGMTRILRAAMSLGSDTTDASHEHADPALARKLGILEAAAVVHGLPNFFDYFQPDRDRFVRQLLHAVVDQAESWIARIGVSHGTAWAQRGFVERCYRASAHLLREVYKAGAYEDAARLQELPELERSLRVIAFERTGMAFQHVLDRHATAAVRAADVADLVLASGERSQTRAQAA